MSTEDKDAEDAPEADDPPEVDDPSKADKGPKADGAPKADDQPADREGSWSVVSEGTLGSEWKPPTFSAQKPSKSLAYWQTFGLIMVCLIGFVLPIIALGVEMVTHICAEVFVDPIPTWWHIALVASVAVVNIFGFRALRRKLPGHPLLPIGVGLALGISTFYALVFAPLTPVFVVAMIFAGIGLLGLAPLLSLISGVIVAVRLRNLRRTHKMGTIAPGLLQGYALAALAVILLEGPVVATHYGLVQARSTDPEVSRAGIRLIRTFGNEQAVLRDCYEHTRSVSDISWCLLDSASWVSISDARKIYYRAYGRPFNSSPRPARVNFASLDETRWTDWDYEVAGEHVGGQAAGVKLVESQIKGQITADAAVSSEQWTMVFSNSSFAQQEARTQIKLPPGGVVSGVTLWINGEPREAAFGERKLVRAAYQNVVAHKRDPLLVTTCGPDRIMVQCFPIPPKVNNVPGQMKIRLSITAPCKLTTGETANLIMPRLVEKNFAVGCEHQIELISDKPLRSDRLQLAADTWHGTQQYTASVKDSVLSSKGVSLIADRSPRAISLWSEAPLPGADKYIGVLFTQEEPSPPSNLIVVIDGSQSMGRHAKEIVDGLSAIPKSVSTSVIFASDEKASITNDLSMDGTEPLRVVLNELTKAQFVGGPANGPYLAKAFRLARKRSFTSIVWIHGPQPIASDKAIATAASMEYKLYDVEAESGPNRILDADMYNANIDVVPRTDNLANDLKTLFTGWTRLTGRMNIAPTFYAPGDTDQKIPAISNELVNLWAYDQTKELLKKRDEAGAVKLASRYRLVTPVTGAVVLETKADYKANGIDPDNPDNNASSPAFNMGAAPEPEENLLIAVALMFIGWQIWKKRLQLRPAR